MSELDLTCEFALVAIRKNRRKLERLILHGGSVNVVITGTLSGVWGRNDGIDQEFRMDVKSLKVGKVSK